MPSTGPAASTANAGPQPAHRIITGIRWIVVKVSANPRQVCKVSIVPVRPGAASSAMLAENCGGIRNHGDAPDQAECDGDGRMEPEQRPG